MIEFDMAVVLGVPVWAYIIIVSSFYMVGVIVINHRWGARREMRKLNKEM